jgi:hypothetical protein
VDALEQWLTSTAVSQTIQTTSWLIPGLQTIHILALATLFGAALMLTMKVLGRAWSEQTPAEVAGRFAPTIWICLVVLLVTGALLITAEPGRTLTNISFFWKMGMLVAAIVLTLAISGAARRGTLGPLHRALAVISMLLWGGIIIAGRYIAYT